MSLFTLLKTLESNKIIWPILLGMSIGLAFLTKYAALYFVIILICLIIFNQRFKKNVFKFVLTICIFLLVCAPNLYWNYVNDLSTFSHTAYNANLETISLNYFEPIKFMGSQLVICGPFILIAYLFKITKIKSYSKNEFLLICFSLPILILIIIQAFLKTSNANWAATAFPGIIILIGSFIYNQKNKIILAGIKFNLLINIGIFALLIKIFITGNLNPIDLKSDPLRKLKGYSEQSKAIKLYLDSEKPSALIFSRRSDITKFSYQLKLFENKEIKRYYLTLRKKPINHYEYNYNFKDHSLKKNDVVLIISSLDGIDKKYIKYFDKFETIGKTIFKETENSVRSYYIIRANMK
jgi:4-amino-4-deoxy-L-arabinose transferase-like glycosyltransferase